jgi:tRNA threonylcarbamoyladenosine biosynthesis protein TsaE
VILRLTTRSAEETVAAAKAFGRQLRHGDCVALLGTLGAGKTQFVKGVCAAFDVHEPVASPTFVLMNRYSGRDAAGAELLLHHFDLYRVTAEDELFDIGMPEFLRAGVSLVEWADRFPALLPQRRYDVRLTLGDEPQIRQIEIEPVGEAA